MAMLDTHPIARLAPVKIVLKPTLQQLVTDFGMTNQELAGALRVDRRTLERWEAGETFPRPTALESLQQLIALHERLADTFETVEAMRTWLHRPLPFLGGMAPIDAVKVGRMSSVDAALEAIDEGFMS